MVKHGVDLVMSGHVHAYDRSWPVADNGSTIEKAYEGT